MTPRPDPFPNVQRLRARRWLLGLLALWLLYMVGASVFLNSSMAERVINRHPERFNLHWRGAVSLYPGHLRAWGVEARGHVRQVRWQAQASWAHARLALLPLLWRELRLPGIRAGESRFDAWPVAEEMLPRPPSDRAWTLSLPAIHTRSLQRARWDTLVLDGRLEARFGMQKELRGGPLTVLPSTLSSRGARLELGGHTLLEGVDAQLGFAMPQHLPADYEGLERLQLMEASVALEGKPGQLRVRLPATGTARLERVAGDGRLRVDLALHLGEWRRGGHLDLQLPVLTEAVEGDAPPQLLELGLRIDEDLHLRALLPPAHEDGLRLDVDLRIAERRFDPIDWRGLLSQTSGRAALRWHFDSLHWLSGSMVRGSWLVLDGHAELEADLDIEQGQFLPGSRFEVPQAAFVVQVLGHRFSGDTRAEGRIENRDGAPHTHIGVTADRFAIAPADAPDQPYVEGSDLGISLEAAGDPLSFRDGATARLKFGDAEVQDLGRYNRYLPEQALRFRGGRGTLSGDMNLDAEGRVSDGHFDIRAQAAALRIADLDLEGDVHIAGKLVSAKLDEPRVVVDGSRIELARVSYQDRKGVQRRDWWARIALPEAQAEGGSPLKIDGSAQVVMKDIGLLLALFERRKPFPRWAAALIDAGETEVQGRAQVRGKHVVLDRLEAENDRFSLKARLRLAEGRAEGDLLLMWGLLALGVELDPEDRDYRFLRPRTWFEQRPHLLPD